MPSVISGDANVSATEFGFLDGVTSSLQTQIDSKLPLAGGKILQVVRATDSTDRTTTSATYVDVTGMSVTITPQKSDSAIVVIALFIASPVITGGTGGLDATSRFRITDTSNNPISGANGVRTGILGFDRQTGTSSALTTFVNMKGYSTPATTSSVTYKLRFLCEFGSSARVQNSINHGQMYAIEVSA